MAFSSSDHDDVVSEINITPLVDVMLVLLVAFIVTAPMLNNSVHVNLPKTTATAKSEQEKHVTVSVNESGKLFIDKRELPSPAAVASELAQLKVQTPLLTVHVQADEKVAYGPVAKVMAAIEKAGITRLSLLTSAE